MSEAAIEIIKRFGWRSIPAGIAFAVAVWAIAHFAAAPGSQVRVLFGLAEYTKEIARPDAESSTPVRPAGATSQSAFTTGVVPPVAPQDRAGTSLSIRLVPNVGPRSDEATLANDRARHGLRELTGPESGRPLREVPSGVYGFIFGGFLDHRPSERESGGAWIETFSDNVARARVDRYRESASYAEVRRLNEAETSLVVFVSEETAALLGSQKAATVQAFAMSRDDANVMAVIPIQRITGWRMRETAPAPGRRVTVFDVHVN